MPQGQFPAILAGQLITAALLQSMVPVTAYKAVDTSRSNTTTPAADADLVIPVAANATYQVHGYLIATGAAIGTGDIVIDFTGPASSTFHYTTSGYSTSATTTLAMSAARTSGNCVQGVNGSAAS